MPAGIRMNSVRFPFLFALALISLDASARPRLARTGIVPLPSLQRILWIGAHPDDEAHIAPLLGLECVEGSATCSMIVMTIGENGWCGLAAGCLPSLGSVRTVEMQTAAAALHVTLHQFDLPDVSDDVAGTWARARPALVDEVNAIIDREQPTVIITFDPTHGSTCHPAHRAVGALVVELMSHRTASIPLLLVETAAHFDDSGIHLVPAIEGNVPHPLFAIPDAAKWRSLDMQLHASQFTPSQIASIGAPNIEFIFSEQLGKVTYVERCEP